MGGVGVGGWVLFWIVFELFLSRIYCVFEACFSSSFYAPSVIRNGENKKIYIFFVGVWGLGSGRIVTQCGPYRSEG